MSLAIAWDWFGRVSLSPQSVSQTPWLVCAVFFPTSPTHFCTSILTDDSQNQSLKPLGIHISDWLVGGQVCSLSPKVAVNHLSDFNRRLPTCLLDYNCRRTDVGRATGSCLLSNVLRKQHPLLHTHSRLLRWLRGHCCRSLMGFFFIKTIKKSSVFPCFFIGF